MKIAIQGHPTRGKEIIQILESLGGKKLYYFNADDKHLVFFIDDKGYISCLHRKNSIIKEYYKIYTLEEFEEEFPFKPGDTVIDKDGDEGCIARLCNINGYVYYSVKYNYNQFTVQLPKSLKLKKKEMNTRNITLTLDKAREWYQKGGELREIALQAFSEKELNLLPTSWEEYVKIYGIPDLRCIFNGNCPKKYITLWKLEQLRDCYRQGWTPDWTNHRTHKHCIIMQSDVPTITVQATLNQFFSFQSFEVAKEFLENFESLIKEAEDLI